MMDAAPAAARRIAALLGHLSPDSATSGVSLQACAATTSSRRNEAPPLPLRLSAEVAAALAAGGPCVALESTIVAHGMPFPRNLETALAVEAAVRAAGATPATIAILGGACCIGLSTAQLEALARAGPAVRKVSRRDLPAVIASGGDGATTVAGTMILAAAAGIDVFVTGGIGGVHRGGESTLDVSADLTELGRTPVAVVCAGAKSILDLSRTLEVLETQGVCVAAYGADAFPAFFVPDSGLKAPSRVDTPAQAAALILALKRLRLSSGALIAVPIPAAATAAGAAIQAAIDAALAEAAAAGVSGARVTPFLLEGVRRRTGGASLEANIRLVLNNAAVGGAIAVELAAQQRAAAAAAARSGGGGGGGGA
jgi:pseudouridine-5'-phosphate glycosidase